MLLLTLVKPKTMCTVYEQCKYYVPYTIFQFVKVQAVSSGFPLFIVTKRFVIFSVVLDCYLYTIGIFKSTRRVPYTKQPFTLRWQKILKTPLIKQSTVILRTAFQKILNHHIHKEIKINSGSWKLTLYFNHKYYYYLLLTKQDHTFFS